MITQLTLDPVLQLISNHHIAEVWQNKATGQNSLHATISFRPGEVISDFSAGTIVDHPTYLTVQVDTDKHITLQPEFLQYANHSCHPNAFFDTTLMQFICLRPIQEGEEITFFYPSTEWSMVQPFYCYCGYEKCLQDIRGAAHIHPDTIKQY